MPLKEPGQVGGVGAQAELRRAAAALAAESGGQVFVALVERSGRMVQVHNFEDGALLELALETALAGARSGGYHLRAANE